MPRWVYGCAAIACADCHATNQTPAIEIAEKPLPDVAIVDAAPDVDTTWHGDGCASAPSRDAINVDSVVVEGFLFPGRHHCYLDLTSPLCFRYPAAADASAELDDAGLDHVRLDSLRIPCDDNSESRSFVEVEFRGSVHGAIEPIVGRRGNNKGWTVDARSSLLRRIVREINVTEPSERLDKLDELKQQLVRCFRSGPAGRVTIDLDVGAIPPPTSKGGTGLSTAGLVQHVTAAERAFVSEDVEHCTINAAQETIGKTLFTSAPLHVRVPITFLVSYVPFPIDAGSLP